MALDPGAGRRSISPESSGRESPLPRQWRNQLGVESPIKDKAFRKYASGVERALTLFETALQEWADYISFLNRLLKALQARQPTITTIPAKANVAKRLSQCLNPSLPSGVHQKTLEVYNYVFSVIGRDGLSRDLPLYLPGLAPTLSFASLSVRSPYLDLLEKHFLDLDARALRPAMKSVILALLPGLEDESSEDFDRTLKLVERFKVAIRPSSSQELGPIHATGDDFFWQCFFLASITGQSRRSGALAYLVRYLPKLGQPYVHDAAKDQGSKNGTDADEVAKLAEIVTSPEPGLLLRAFAAGLADEQLLIQRGYLDLLVTHLPLHSKVLQSRVKAGDLDLLLRAAAGVVIRRDMSLNRRLWAWLLGPEPVVHDQDAGPESPRSPSDRHSYFASKTSYFEEFGLQPMTQALLAMVKAGAESSPAERARPYRICLSLMDRWEIGGLVVPEVFLPIIDSVRSYKAKAQSKADFNEVLRSASVFFDGVESGLIYGEIVGLLAQAIGPGDVTYEQQLDKLALVNFIVANFNVREEEMITIHAPLAALSVLSMLEDAKERRQGSQSPDFERLSSEGLNIAAALLDLVPDRAFPSTPTKPGRTMEPSILASLPNLELLKKLKEFYVNDQGNLDSSPPPFSPVEAGELLFQKACNFCCDGLSGPNANTDMEVRSRILILLLTKTSQKYQLDGKRLLASLHDRLSQPTPLRFISFSSILSLSTYLYSTERVKQSDLSDLVAPLARHAWSFLSASEPKYHVETVRSLWRLQTALTPYNRDVEAAISALMIENDTAGTFAARSADPGRSFCVLWSHSLLDNPSHLDRRGSKTPITEKPALPRLSGVDHYEVMLTRPLFLMLDALLDERTQLFMTAKTWLNSLVGIDKLFMIFVAKFSELSFLRNRSSGDPSEADPPSVKFTDFDDLDLCLYYLRTLSNIFRWSPDIVWGVLASKSVSIDDAKLDLRQIVDVEGDLTVQEFFLHVCMRCIAGNEIPSEKHLQIRVTQLNRTALTVLHQILLNPYAEPLSNLHLETTLIHRLSQSLNGPDPYAQVLLLDVVFASLKLRDMLPVELPTSPTTEKRAMSLDPTKSFSPSLQPDSGLTNSPPPPTLLKCLQAGLSSPSSRTVLDSWVSFLTECLPFYSDSIFQVIIPLVETLCGEIGSTFRTLRTMFKDAGGATPNQGTPESTLISLLNGLEQVLARAHERLLAEEARAQVVKSPDQPQGFFGNMVSGVFATDAPQSRSATANDRLTVHLAFQDAVRICYMIWSWGQGNEANSQDPSSAASFNYTALRMRNRARRLLEHLFAAESLECLETVIDIWKHSINNPRATQSTEVFNLFPALDGCRPKNTIPAIFNAIYSRTNPGALDPSRKSTLTISLQDTDLVIFLVDYARSLEDDAMDEIWQDCATFLRDLLGNPFPHRQTLPSLIEFAAILGEKVDNTNFGEQRKMRRDLGDLFLRLLTALFTTRPMTFAEASPPSEKSRGEGRRSTISVRGPAERADDVVGILSTIVPNLPKILVETDRVLSAAATISANVINPALRSKAFPDTISKSMLELLYELSRLPGNQKAWKKDVGDAFHDARFFNSSLQLVKTDWLPLLRQWSVSDKERIPEILAKISPPSTAGIVFGVGATSARLDADRKTQLNLRRLATLILASNDDAYATELGGIVEKLVELLGATATSSPSSTTRAEVYLVVRTLVLKMSAVHLTTLWPVVNAELHAAISSVVAADHSAASDTYNNSSVLQACKLLDLLVCAAPDDFQLHEWLFVTDTVDAVYRPSNAQPVALVDELSEELGSAVASAGLGSSAPGAQSESAAHLAATAGRRRPLLGPGGIGDEVGLERKDELVAKVLRPFFGQLSIFAFESTYAMGALDRDFCVQGVLKDLFDERSIVRAL